ncbi:hypothetical protein BDW59DRAFT_163938 [Aspergillus cavernicola]|uniref:GPI anchored protein n=1 Tax=Aspergillus cavernicola TaxID=176166 RepID=A0ABR4I4H5_9EURO
MSLDLLSKMNIFVVFVLFLYPVIVHASSPGLSDHASSFPNPRRLAAATLSSRLKAREVSPVTLFKRKMSFDYLADEIEGESVFATTLDVESQWPILALEDLDAGLDSVSCTDSQIQLVFVSMAAEEAFNTAIDSMSEFVIVTSHDGCDFEGERSAHRVTGVTINLEHHLVTLDKDRMGWHEAFSTTLSFSHRHPAEIQKRAALLERQQTTTSPYPPAPTDTDGLNSSANADFNVHHQNVSLYPIDNVIADQVVTCALQGDIQLSEGQFNVEDTWGPIDEAIGFFRNGSVELLVRELFSQIDLEFELELDEPLVDLTMALPTIPLTPFQIAGVVTFGPQILPEIILTVDVEGDIGFSYGFNVTVPENSRILINMTSVEDSEMTGFQNTTFEAFPFEASTEVTSMALNVTFRPQVLLGISTGTDVLNTSIDGGIGAFVGLPKLSLNVTQVSGVNENCESVAETNDVVGNATHLIPTVELNMGVRAGYDVQIMDYQPDTPEVSTVWELASWELPTACVLFEPEIQATGTVGTLATEDDSRRDGDNGDSSDGSNSAATFRGSGGITLMCGTVLSIIAAGFCGWG